VVHAGTERELHAGLLALQVDLIGVFSNCRSSRLAAP
jgi:hypothetical protein